MPVNPKSEKGRFELDAKSICGVWLGILQRSGEDLVGTEEGVIKASAVRRVPHDERWRQEDVFFKLGALLKSPLRRSRRKRRACRSGGRRNTKPEKKFLAAVSQKLRRKFVECT